MRQPVGWKPFASARRMKQGRQRIGLLSVQTLFQNTESVNHTGFSHVPQSSQGPSPSRVVR